MTSAPERVHLDAGELVVEDASAGTFRVDRKALTSAELAGRELSAVFGSSWLYVGHESEVPRPGDYVRRAVLGQPVIFVRGKDEQVRVLYNSCSHRGAMVCRKDSGNDQRFQCFYHGWTFDLSGKLINVPRVEAYGDSFDPADRALPAPPRAESYRGMWFLNLDPDAPSLAEYLSDVAEYIDLSFDSAEPLGGWEVVPGVADYDIKANWKLLVENSVDMYHFATVHLTYSNFVAERRRQKTGTRQSALPRTAESVGFSTPMGHGGFVHSSAGRPIATEGPEWSDEANSELVELRGRLLEQFGEERGLEMSTRSRHILIYPNLIFQDSATGFRVRAIWPRGAGAMQVLQWEFRPRHENAEVSRHRMNSSRAFLGPGGFGTPDDVEALESCQIGYRATHDESSDYSRGFGKDEFSSDDEEQMRGFWRRWREQMGSGGGTTARRAEDRPGADIV